MILTLTLPPTDNQLRGVMNGTMLKTRQYREWENTAAMEFLQYKQLTKVYNPTYEKQMRFKMKLNLSNKRRDISNFTKAIKDFLTSRLWIDDKWVDLDIQMPVIVDPKLLYETVEIETVPQIYTHSI